VKPRAVFGNFFCQLVLFGESAGTVGVIAGIHWMHPVKPRASFGDFFSLLVILGETAGTLGKISVFLQETAGILGRHLVKPQVVPGDLELLLQHPQPSYRDLAVNKLLEEFVDWPRIRELHDAFWPPSPLFSHLTPADCCQLHPPEPTLEWEDHHLMKGSPLTLRGESEKSGGRGRGKVGGGKGGGRGRSRKKGRGRERE